MSDELKRALIRVAEAAAAVVAMRLALESLDSLELAGQAVKRDVRRVLDRIRAHVELEREVRRGRNGVVFEAWLATREGATDGD